MPRPQRRPVLCGQKGPAAGAAAGPDRVGLPRQAPRWVRS